MKDTPYVPQPAIDQICGYLINQAHDDTLADVRAWVETWLDTWCPAEVVVRGTPAPCAECAAGRHFEYSPAHAKTCRRYVNRPLPE